MVVEKEVVREVPVEKQVRHVTVSHVTYGYVTVSHVTGVCARPCSDVGACGSKWSKGRE